MGSEWLIDFHAPWETTSFQPDGDSTDQSVLCLPDFRGGRATQRRHQSRLLRWQPGLPQADARRLSPFRPSFLTESRSRDFRCCCPVEPRRLSTYHRNSLLFGPHESRWLGDEDRGRTSKTSRRSDRHRSKKKPHHVLPRGG